MLASKMEQKRIGPRHPRLGAAGFRLARWLAAKTMARTGLHQLEDPSTRRHSLRWPAKAVARRDPLHRWVRLPRHAQHRRRTGRGHPGKDGPRLIVNNEEERFSGNKHTNEFPQHALDDMGARCCNGMGRDVGDIEAWVTTHGTIRAAGTLVRTILEEAPQSLKLLRAPMPPASTAGGRPVTRTPSAGAPVRAGRSRAADLRCRIMTITPGSRLRPRPLPMTGAGRDRRARRHRRSRLDLALRCAERRDAAAVLQ